MKKLLLTLAAVVALSAQAQQFEVVSTQQLSVGAEDVFHPVFTPDGNSLLVSSANYDGLGIVDIKNQSYQKITEQVDVSTATIGRVSKCLNYGSGGYRAAIEKLSKAGDNNE